MMKMAKTPKITTNNPMRGATVHCAFMEILLAEPAVKSGFARHSLRL